MNPSTLIKSTTALITGPHTVSLIDEDLSALPGPSEILVKTLYTLISPGTELAIFQHTHAAFADPHNSFAKYPFRPGYAAVAQVMAVGDRVTGIQEDDLIYYNGKHQTYARVDTAKINVLVLPRGLDPRLAVFARMAQISSSALEISTAVRGGTVAVLGQGVVGNLAAQLFRERGCAVIGLDLIPFRCEAARRCGLRAIQATPANVVAEVLQIFGGQGADTVVEATGHPLAVTTGLQMTARQGEMILLGSTRGKVELDVYSLIHKPMITVRGAHERVCGQAGDARPRELLQQHLAAIATGQLIIPPLLTEVLPYQDIAQAYHRLSERTSDTLALVLEW